MGTLYVVATPIGNLEDITLRAIRILLTAPVIACEDTRRTGQLIKLLSQKEYPFSLERILLSRVSRKFISVRDWNEAKVVSSLLSYLVHTDVALVSDAGTPLISDPGFKVVRAARQAGFMVSPIPGPSAAIAALSVAGLPTDKFIFLGFLPKKWELYPNITNIIYESPVRSEKTLKEISRRYPDAHLVIARELTKIHEYIGKDDGVYKGEITILVNFSPSSPTPVADP